MVVFWEALNPMERDAFRLFAFSRTFAAGARLMREGDQSDYVIVILSGKTKICVEEHGRERVLAVRGPGQLVGERGALQISVRSASVIALETVQALIARTDSLAPREHRTKYASLGDWWHDESRMEPDLA